MNFALNPRSQEAYQLLHDGALALTRCEQQGMRVDLDYIKKQQKKVTKKISKLEQEFKDTDFYYKWRKSVKGKLNIYSADQLRHFLYEVEDYPVEKLTDNGKASTDSEALQELNIPDLEPYLKISKLKSLTNTFLASLEREVVNGKIHPFFHLHIPTTYRGSSSDPNFQNFPKRDEEQMQVIRGAIYPSKGHQLLELDYSQLEVRVAATYHKDPTMLKYIRENHDMHGDMAQQLFFLKKYDSKIPGHKVLRGAAKNGFVFPAFYGDYHVGFAKSLASFKWGKLPRNNKWSKNDGIPLGDSTLADHLIKNGIDHLGIPDGRESASGFTQHLKEIEQHFWNKRFPVYNQWREDWYKDYLKKGFFWSHTGFTYQGAMTRKDAINYPVQGSAFHILLWSLTEATKVQIRERWKSKIIGQIHDAIVIDVHPKELQHVINVMKCIMVNDVRQHWKWINVPLEIEAELCPVDAPWSKKEEYKIN